MKLQIGQGEEPELNLTSLIDVVLLLVIFFMVSTSFVRESELQVQLPEATAEAPATGDNAMEIIINAEGQYFLNGEQLVDATPVVLQRAIQKTFGDTRDIPVTIRADARTTHQSVVTVMDIAGKMGFVNITIITANEGGS